MLQNKTKCDPKIQFTANPISVGVSNVKYHRPNSVLCLTQRIVEKRNHV